MRKVYMSFLGTTNYFSCNYIFDNGRKVKNVRFVQEATIRQYCENWNAEDLIVIFTTDESHGSNWLDNGHRQNGDPLDLEGLAGRIKKIKCAAQVNEIRIPAGKDEEEIWAIFQTILDIIEEKDHVFFDITHAFRSLPLLAMVAINYAKIIKNIRVGAIGYGAMEAIGQAGKIKKLRIDERNVPVFNLLAFDQLLDWSAAIDRFITAGDATALTRLTSLNITPRLRETKGQDREAAALRDMATSLTTFVETLASCRGRRISQDGKALKKSVAEIQEQQLVKPLIPLVGRLNDAMADFSGDEVQDGIAAAKWCRQHNLIQQGFTILQETAITHILIQSINADSTDIDKRNLVGKAVKITLNDISEDGWDQAARDQKALIDQICGWLTPQKMLLDCLRNMSQSRNDLNHAGMNPNPMAGDKFKPKLQEYIETLSLCCR